MAATWFWVFTLAGMGGMPVAVLLARREVDPVRRVRTQRAGALLVAGLLFSGIVFFSEYPFALRLIPGCGFAGVMYFLTVRAQICSKCGRIAWESEDRPRPTNCPRCGTQFERRRGRAAH